MRPAHPAQMARMARWLILWVPCALGAMEEVHIGSSYGYKTRCVTPRGPVQCPRHVSHIGHYPDTFEIYQRDGKVCARRTDYDGDWSIHLKVLCQRGSGGLKPSGRMKKVSIGSSLDSHVKCVEDPGNVHCDHTAKQLGRTGKYPDSFDIYHHGRQICARRTDAEAGWGLDLVLECRSTRPAGKYYGHSYGYHSYDPHPPGYSGPTGGGIKKVSIGSSLDSHVKCVEDPGNVHCDHTAKQLGRTGKYPDTFDIYHEGRQICARRTDAEAGWGLDLVLECKQTFGGGGHGSYHGGFTPGYHGGYHGHHGSYGGSSFDPNSASYKQRKKQVVIGASPENYIKCVADPGHVKCDNTAKQLGRTGEYPDSFHIYHKGTEICAERTDAKAAWGLNLILECDLYYGAHYGGSLSNYKSTTLQIGSQPSSSLKCVKDPGHLLCDDTAEQIGRTGEYPDTFHIYHQNEQICAQRTDADSGWGLNLVVDCRPKHQQPGKDYYPGSAFYITAKVKWCCENSLFSTACPYDCDTGASSIHSMWTSAKQEWCCRNRGKGCTDGTAAPSSGPSDEGESEHNCHVADPASEVAVSKEDYIPSVVYDCTHGSREMWTQDKTQYCRLWMDVPSSYKYADCHSNPSGWSREKERWCKEMRNKELHAPHKCREGHPDSWTQQKFEFCCVIKGIGCRQEEPLQLVLPERLKETRDRNDWEDDASEDMLDKIARYPRPNEGPDTGGLTLHFDCVAKDPADLHDWSATRQRWCCQKWGLGCEAIGAFNCSEGFWNWQRGWSGQKKNYCCKHEKKGCDGTTYDCTQDTRQLSAEGKEWCCKHHMYSKGCPFNCQHGLKEWKIGFSTAKKSWCCNYEKLACPEPEHPHVPNKHHVIHHSHTTIHHATLHHGSHSDSYWLSFGGAHSSHDKDPPGFAACHNIADRPQGLVDWCCGQMGLCHLSVQFDCHVAVASWPRWSREKKQHCCGREVHCGQVHEGASHVFHAVHGLDDDELDDPKAWFNKNNVMNLHVGQSPNAGIKCVTPSVAVSCPMDAGNVRDDEYPDRFRVYRKGGQVCAQRTDYDKLWGLDLVLKCIKLDDHHFQKVHIGSSLGSSKKCVAPKAPVTCDDSAAQAGRTDPHPDTFHVYHSGREICVKRTDADSHWGVDLVLYCRQGSWSSPYWDASRMRTLEDDFYDKNVPQTTGISRKPWMFVTLAAFAVIFVTAAVMTGKAYRQHRRTWTLLEVTEERLDSLMNGRTPWLARPAGDVDLLEEEEMVLA